MATVSVPAVDTAITRLAQENQLLFDRLTGAVAVAVPDRPRSMGVADLVAEMAALNDEIREVVTAADQVWSELSPGIDRCAEALRTAAAAGAELGLPDAGASATLQTRLADLRTVLLTDPLLRWTGSGVDRAAAAAVAGYQRRVNSDADRPAGRG